MSSNNGLRNAVELAVARLRQDAKGAMALTEWIGKGAMPVDHELAESRAAVCARCPQNVRKKRVENTVAETIRKHEEARSKVNLRTSHDLNLHNCVTCGCYLKLKVWVPLKNQTEAAFPPHCWVRKESEVKKDPTAAPAIVPRDMRRRIGICRTGAFGDVIMASIIATKMNQLGFEVDFSANEHARTALYNHPHIHGFLEPNARCAIELDGCYENSSERTVKDISQLMIERASIQLASRGFPVPHPHNRVPVLGLTPEESIRIEEYLSEFPKPWTVIVPKSASWPNRSVNQGALATAAGMLPGTAFWAFPSPAPNTTVPFKMNVFRDLMAIVSKADLVITPDTGPLHIAAAFNRKVIYLETCNRPWLRVTDLTDYTSVSSSLDCVGCGHMVCPINREIPPCREIASVNIGYAAIQKLETHSNGNVSAIIPVYRYADRLNRAIEAVRDQVHEVIIAVDGDCKVPPYGGNVRVIQNPGGKRHGYGKTCNRGARNAVGEFLLMLNDDCYLKPGAVEAMKRVMRDRIAVVGAQLWYPDGTIQHGGTGRNRGDIGFGHLDHRKTVPSITSPRQMESVTFAAALVRRSAFYAVRGFDEQYDCYSEDADFCMKVRQAGWGVMYQPHAVGIHDESQTTSPTKSRMLADGHAIFKAKWEHFFLTNPPL